MYYRESFGRLINQMGNMISGSNGGVAGLGGGWLWGEFSTKSDLLFIRTALSS